MLSSGGNRQVCLNFGLIPVFVEGSVCVLVGVCGT